MQPVQESRSELLDLISSMKKKLQDKLGHINFPIPQFIIVGKQSVGKSRLIESLAGEVFNFVSSTLGSRRPTVLEFRNCNIRKSRWFVMNDKSRAWEEMDLGLVLKKISSSHDSLGLNVSDVPIYVKVESPHCVDMNVTDLPGFREFALDAPKQKLADQIEKLNTQFMKDPRNVMICVEEAGDAANLATLTKCRREDPKFERTVLVRNKLDKYYRDLTKDNVNDWVHGFDDLPRELRVFSLTLPHWKEDVAHPPEPFVELRKAKNDEDIHELKSRGASETVLKTIGYKVFAQGLSDVMEAIFADSIDPVFKKLTSLKKSADSRIKDLEEQLDLSNPKIMLNSVREAGMAFGQSLQHVMEGFVRAETNRMTLEEEINEFYDFHENTNADFLMVPSKDFPELHNYIDCLRHHLVVPAMDVEVNGGAQFRRLMFEIEVACRFAEIDLKVTKRDIIQVRGNNMHNTTWQDSIIRLLSNAAYLPLRKRVQYIAERIKFFFYAQKPVMLDFMTNFQSSTDGHIYSSLFARSAKMMKNNEMAKNMIFDIYDRTVNQQFDQFLNLFHVTLSSTFANPWVFLKKNMTPRDTVTSEKGHKRARLAEDLGSETLHDAKARVMREVNNPSDVEIMLLNWLIEIPSDPSRIDEAVEKTRTLMINTFEFIRSKIADQIEIFAESFFKVPMQRRLEEEMSSMDLDPSEKRAHQEKRAKIQKEMEKARESSVTLRDCIVQLEEFCGKTRK